LIVNACKVTDIRFPPLVDVCDSFAMIGLYVVFEDVFFSHSCCHFSLSPSMQRWWTMKISKQSTSLPTGRYIICLHLLIFVYPAYVEGEFYFLFLFS